MEGEVRMKTLKLLNLIAACLYVQDLNDGLAGTEAYQQKLKFHSKGLAEELEKHLSRNLEKAYRADEEIFQNIIRNKEQLLQTLGVIALEAIPEDFVELNNIVQLYFKNRAEFQAQFTPTLLKINDQWEATPHLKPKNSEDSTT